MVFILCKHLAVIIDFIIVINKNSRIVHYNKNISATRLALTQLKQLK